MTALVHFDAQGRWGETLVCEARVREQLALHDLWVQPNPAVQDSGLFYVALPGGWLGVLCDAGECLVAPASVHVSDRPEGLPAHGEFVDRLLELLGEEQE
ncbi:hypothetical protein LZ009_01515 [Ramlibacter sp. XY19]|uniref:hypothetical protein n=1 Tax=Ramlibacter paludis TaxID=2908000 RepID=UPI0023DC6384|nr:hypothetical protein [Ramlibacter paludis]MCG2591457.1 hypothetical protein [Ramlibacter paludis]